MIFRDILISRVSISELAVTAEYLSILTVLYFVY